MLSALSTISPMPAVHAASLASSRPFEPVEHFAVTVSVHECRKRHICSEASAYFHELSERERSVRHLVEPQKACCCVGAASAYACRYRQVFADIYQQGIRQAVLLRIFLPRASVNALTALNARLSISVGIVFASVHKYTTMPFTVQ